MAAGVCESNHVQQLEKPLPGQICGSGYVTGFTNPDATSEAEVLLTFRYITGKTCCKVFLCLRHRQR